MWAGLGVVGGVERNERRTSLLGLLRVFPDLKIPPKPLEGFSLTLI